MGKVLMAVLDSRGSSGGNNSAGAGGDAELSEYEKERQENIRRNEAHLREMGLDSPIVPPRPRPAPRQPCPPRAPDGPRRVSSRLQGAPRPRYADVEKSDKEEDENTLEKQADEAPLEQQVQDPLPAQIQQISRGYSRRNSRYSTDTADTADTADSTAHTQ
jgi:hypothetical protein